MARWHKRLPSPTLPPFPRVCCHCLCVSTCLVTHTQTHTLNRAKMAHRSQWTMPAPHGAAFRALHVFVWVSVCVCGAWVWALSCATLCNIFFVICFLCVCLFFGVTRQRRLVFVLVACHTHTHVAVCMCVGFVAKCVAVSVWVCVPENVTLFLARKATPRLSHSRPHSGLHSKAHTHLHTPAYQSVEKSIWRCHPWVADWRCAVATFVVILWQHL